MKIINELLNEFSDTIQARFDRSRALTLARWQAVHKDARKTMEAVKEATTALKTATSTTEIINAVESLDALYSALDHLSAKENEALETYRSTWEEERTTRLNFDQLRSFVASRLKDIDPALLTRSDMQRLSEILDPFRPKRQGRKGQDLSRVAMYWATFYALQFHERGSDFALVGVVDDMTAEFAPKDVSLEKPGSPIGPSSVRRAKERFRPYIDRVIDAPERWQPIWQAPRPDEDLDAAT